MAIKLIKACKELNIGVSTAVEFLTKNGFEDVQTDPTVRISDDAYLILAKEFDPILASRFVGNVGMKKETIDVAENVKTEPKRGLIKLGYVGNLRYNEQGGNCFSILSEIVGKEISQQEVDDYIESQYFNIEYIYVDEGRNGRVVPSAEIANFFQFRTPWKSREGGTLYGIFKKITYNEEDIFKGVYWGKSLLDAYNCLMAFAKFPGDKDAEESGYDSAIKQLAGLVLPGEQWYYGEKDDGKFQILKNYIQQTYVRLQVEDFDHREDNGWKKKILFSDTYAIFNTGLVDSVYEPIYAVFKKNVSKLDVRKWVFWRFMGYNDDKRHILTRTFGEDSNLPLPAHYYESTSELVYDVRAGIGSVNIMHILDRCDRLPLEFIRNNHKDFDYNRKPNGTFYRELQTSIKSNPDSVTNIKEGLERAIKYAIKKVNWNFKMAIPIYYPTTEKISLLLPLALVRKDVIDAALVIEAVNSETHQRANIVHTVLTLKMAYMDARLITRPDSEWLTTEKQMDSQDNKIDENNDVVDLIEDGVFENDFVNQESQTQQTSVGTQAVETAILSSQMVSGTKTYHNPKRILIDGNVFEGVIVLNKGYKNIKCECYPYPLKIEGDSRKGDYEEDEIVEFVAKSRPNPKDNAKLYWYAIDVKLKD